MINWTSLFFLVGICFTSQAAPWNPQNNPLTLSLPSSTGGDALCPTSRHLEFTFSELPTNVTVSSVPWSDTYWPSYQGGLAYRWHADDPEGFDYSLHSKTQLRSMTFKDLASLSPAEKYDIYNQRYDYPTVKSEWKRTSPETPEWMGLCHGWALAAIHFKEPQAINVTNRDGIDIPFGSSDLKALLTYYSAEHSDRTGTTFVGKRCNFRADNDTVVDTCQDVNAGSFHLLLSNFIGKRDLSFVFDRDKGHEVWNQPVVSFSTEVLHTHTISSSASVPLQPSVPPTPAPSPEFVCRANCNSCIRASVCMTCASTPNGVFVPAVDGSCSLQCNDGYEVAGGDADENGAVCEAISPAPLSPVIKFNCSHFCFGSEWPYGCKEDSPLSGASYCSPNSCAYSDYSPARSLSQYCCYANCGTADPISETGESHSLAGIGRRGSGGSTSRSRGRRRRSRESRSRSRERWRRARSPGRRLLQDSDPKFDDASLLAQGYLPGSTIVRVETKVGFTVETYPQWEAHEDGGVVREQTFRYMLELDDEGHIIGGRYEEDSAHRPDFVWFAPVPEFDGYFRALGDLYDISVGYTGWALPELECEEEHTTAENHYYLTEKTDSVDLDNYDELTAYSWSITPPPYDGSRMWSNVCSNQCPESVCVLITLENLRLAAASDVVRVFEGADCQGDMLALTSTLNESRAVLVKSPSACVVLQAGPREFRSEFNPDSYQYYGPASLQMKYKAITPCRR